MNEEAFKQLYESFVNTGYEGDRQMFIDLMSSNEEAFTQGYDAFTSTGYAGDRTAFANLVGVNDPLKKKVSEEPVVEKDTTEEPVVEENADLSIGDPADSLKKFGPNSLGYNPAVEGDDKKTTEARNKLNLWNAETTKLLNQLPEKYEDLSDKDKELYEDIEGAQSAIYQRDGYPLTEEESALTEVSTPDDMPVLTKEETEFTINNLFKDYLLNKADKYQTLSDNFYDQYQNESEKYKTENFYIEEYGKKEGVKIYEGVKKKIETKEKSDYKLNLKSDLQNKGIRTLDQMFDEEDELELKNKISSIITPDFVGQSDNTATIEKMNQEFSEYGLIFTKSYFGGGMHVTTANGNATIKIDIDSNFSDISEANDLKDFVLLNANPENKDFKEEEEFLSQSQRAQEMRKGARTNNDGTQSSHLMATFEEDGKYIVAPTLFPKDDNNQSKYSSSWVELKGLEALNLAKKRGEVFEFNTEEEADNFARGSWKEVSLIDLEANTFYKERGLNYFPLHDAENEYDKLNDEINFINTIIEDQPLETFGRSNVPKENTAGLTMQLTDLNKANQKKYAHLFSGGVIIDDLQQYQKDLIAKRTVLNGTLDRENIRRTREDFDVVLRKAFDEKSTVAKNRVIEIVEQEKALDKESLLEFQSKVYNIPKIASTITLPSQQQNAVNLYTGYLNLQMEKKMARAKYENAYLYFNRMENKNVQASGYEDNEFKGFFLEGSKGIEQGNSLNAILQYSLGMDFLDFGSATVDPNDVKSVARAIVEGVRNKASKGDTRTMLAWNNANSWEEIFNVIQNDPAEWALQLSANSIGQMLEYGTQIVTVSGAAGAGTGAGYGLLGGNPLTVGGGALTGFGYGLRTGFAATAYAMEYTNAVMETMTNMGYDLTNPMDVETALMDGAMWKKASAQGHARGIPIATVSYFTAGLAGKLLSATNPVISARGAVNVGAALFGEAAIGVGGEALSEVSAQASEIMFQTGRTTFDGKEIVAEMGGSFGTQTSNGAVNMMLINRESKQKQFYQNLTNPDFIANYTEATDEQIVDYINKMIKTGRIDEAQGQNVKKNVGIKRNAVELAPDAAPPVISRLMQLINAKEILSSDVNRREIYKDKLKEINLEIASTVVMGEVSNKTTDLTSGLAGNDVAKINTFNRRPPTFRVGNMATEDENVFKKAINKMTDWRTAVGIQVFDNESLGKELSTIVAQKINYLKKKEADMLGIDLDPSELIKIETDADTKQETGEVVSSQQTYNFQQMEEQVSGENQESPGESNQEEITDLQKARNGDVEAQKKFEKYGIEWKFKPTYRFVGKSELDALNNNETIEGKNKSVGVDVTNSEEVTTATDAEYRVTYKGDVIDSALPDNKLRMKNDVDGHIQGGYTLADVSVIEKINPDGTFEIVYESETTEDVDIEAVERFEQQLDAEESVNFRLKDDAVTEPSREKVESITQKINELESDNVNVKIERDEESVSIDVNELNNRTDNKLNEISFDVVNNLPTSFTISDQLTTGNATNPNTGNTIDNLKGAIGFNGTVGNENAAWASTTEKNAQGMINKAQTVYNNNKKVYDNFWNENPEYNGLVMVNVVKMAEDGIVSNEAMFRVLADNLTKLPEENRVKALKTLKEEIISRRDKAEKKKPFNDIIALLEADNIQSIDNVVAPEFINKLSLGARVNLMNIIGYGKPNKPGETKNAGTISENSTVTRALMENQDKSNNKLVNIGSIAEIITDPQLKNVSELSIIGVVGVDVLNPEVLKSNHLNYPFAPKGKSIGVLSNPVAMEKAYPIAYEKALGSLIEKEQKPSEKKVKGKKVKKTSTKVTGKQLRTNQTGIGIGIASKDYIGALANYDQSNINKLVNFINKSFPSVMMSVDSEVFQQVINEPGTQKYLKGNEIIYGVTKNGDIYINPDVHNTESSLYNTAIHEMGHIWTDYLQTTRKGKRIYARGVELISKTDEYKKQLKKFDGDSKKAADETMAILIGNEGETIANSTLLSKFKEWLFGMWKYIKSQFKMSKDLTEQEIQDMNLDKFIGTALADIFSGKEIALTDIQKKALKNPELAFKKGLSTEDIIYRGRQSGFTQNQIIEVLVRRNKLSKTDAKKAVEDMAINIKVPPAFANIEGGINVGREILQELDQVREARQAKEKAEGKRTNNKSEREARKKEIENNKKFKSLPELDRQNLIIAYDKMLGSKAGVQTQREINEILSELRGRKKQDKVNLATRNKLQNVIQALIPKSDNINKAKLDRLIKKMAKVNEDNFRATVLEVQDIADVIIAKDIKDLRNKISDYVKSKSTAKKSNKKPKAGTVEYRGMEFFKAVDRLMQMSPDELISKQEELAKKESEIDEALADDLNSKNILNSDQVTLLAEVEAFSRMGNINEMSLAELEDMFQALKEETKESRKKLLDRIDNRRKEAAAYEKQADKAIFADNSFLFDKDGRPLTPEEINNNRKNILTSLKDNGFVKTAREYAQQFFSGYKNVGASVNPVTTLRQFFDGLLSHTGTVFNMLDGRKGKFFTKVFQKRLTTSDFNREEGIRNSNTELDNIAKNAGITKGRVKGVPQEIYSKPNLELIIEGQIKLFNADMLMSMYAYSKNNDTRKRQIEQGITDEIIEKIQKHLGNKLVAYVDGVVEWLTNTYFEGVNDVYIKNNDVSLEKIQEYFPVAVQFDSRKSQQADLQNPSNYGSAFKGNSPGSVKTRGNKGPLDLNSSFTNKLNNHIQEMERYKAYADTVSLFNKLLKVPSIANLLDATGSTDLVNKLLNYSINGTLGNSTKMNGLINYLMGGFISYTLNLKLMQIPKQATSSIMAFTNFSTEQPGILGALGRARKKGGITGLAASIPSLPLDGLMFVFRYAQVLAMTSLGKEGGIKTAKRISAGFEKRMNDALKGASIAELESGQKLGLNTQVAIGEKGLSFLMKLPGLNKTELTPRQLSEKLNAFLGAGTTIGDILGVLGYLATYNQDIANGMTEVDATMKFIEYNMTQQSRRDMDKGGLQMEGGLLRLFTTFGSTMLLQLNESAMRARNISRSLANQGEQILKGNFKEAFSNENKVKQEDVRGLLLSGAIANMLFAAASGMVILMRGSDEEKEKVYDKIKLAQYGSTQIEQIPVLGGTINAFIFELVNGRKMTAFERNQTTVEPVERIVREIMREFENGEILNGLKPATEFGVGFQFDFFEGLYNIIMNGDETETYIYDMLGVPQSQRPESGKRKSGGEKKVQKIDKTLLKKYNPKLYQKLLEYERKRKKLKNK